MNKKKVSVIIPVYNCEKYIEKCLRSVIDQTYENIEVIVVDDGSSDNSYQIIKEVTREKSNISIIRQDNQGLSMARNRGLKDATGEYLTFLDGDDFWGRSHVERLVGIAESNQSDMVICGYTKMNDVGEVFDKIIPKRYVPYEHEEWAYRIMTAWSRLYKKQLWDQYQIVFPKGVHAEDVSISLFLNVVSKNIMTIPMSDYYYVQHSESIMHNFRGLHNFRLPYASMERMLAMAETISDGNSREFLELGVMRFLTQCIFDLGRGASGQQLRELCDFAAGIMARYFPDYFHNRKSSLCSDLDIPFINKVEVKIFMWLLKLHLLYPAARLLGVF